MFSPLPSLTRVGGCAVWSAARSSAIVGVLQAHRGLSEIIGNYCASRIGRASANDLHHSAAWPMMARHRAPCAIDEVLHRTGASAEVAGFPAPLLVKSGPCGSVRSPTRRCSTAHTSDREVEPRARLQRRDEACKDGAAGRSRRKTGGTGNSAYLLIRLGWQDKIQLGKLSS